MELSTTAVHVKVKAFKAPQGCLAHLIVDPSTRQALVVDPRLDQVEEILDAAASGGDAIRYVMDTHTHADHLSGVRAVAEAAGAEILAHPKSKAPAARTLEDGATITLGESEVRVVHSPGHTPDSLSLLVGGHLFTGDALFAGSAGRVDFMGGSARDLFRSFRRFEALPRDTVVHPGHDYVGMETTTLDRELEENELLKEQDVERLVGRMDVKAPLPANMKSILAFNTRGPDDRVVSPLELDALLRLGRVNLVDVRSPSEFRSRRIEGAVNVPFGEIGNRASEIPASGETIMICQSGIRSEEAVRFLEKQGRKTRHLDGGMAAWMSANLPTAGTGGVSVERQVQMTIGASVFAGTALGVFTTPWFFIVPAFMGAGLLWAGISGTCTLALVMARLPWNRGNETGTSTACAAPGGSGSMDAGCAPPRQPQS